MQLKTKFIILIALVTCCSYGVTFYRTSSFQEELVVEQATRQAKMLFERVVHVKPKSSRKASKEIYVVGLEKK